MVLQCSQGKQKFKQHMPGYTLLKKAFPNSGVTGSTTRAGGKSEREEEGQLSNYTIKYYDFVFRSDNQTKRKFP